MAGLKVSSISEICPYFTYATIYAAIMSLEASEREWTLVYAVEFHMIVESGHVFSRQFCKIIECLRP